MNKKIGITVAAVVLVAIGAFVFADKETGKVAENSNPQAPVVNQALSETPQVTDPTGVGSYEAYAPEKIAKASVTGKVVLNFSAPWCPSCRALDSDINKNLSSIPAGVTILKTDYDSETALKKKYGVTTQHTLVQVDAQGNMLKKWSGGSKLADLLSQIQ